MVFPPFIWFSLQLIDEQKTDRECDRLDAPQVGLEPTTTRLTAGCSAIELLRNMVSGSDLSFRAVSSQVLSALESLTAVFGMGTGGTSPSLPPVRVLTHFFLCAFQHPVKCAKGFCPFGRTLTTAQIVFNMSDLHN